MARSSKSRPAAKKSRPKPSRVEEADAAPASKQLYPIVPVGAAQRRQGLSELALGAVLILAAAIITMFAIDGNVVTPATYAMVYGPTIAGVAALVIGSARLTPVTARAPLYRDPRRKIYGVLAVIFWLVYTVCVLKVIPNRLPSALLHLWSMPVFTFWMAVGLFWGTRHGWWLAVISGTAVIASAILLILRILVSAAFLAGVYGAFGKAASTFALVAVALLVEVVVLLPLCAVRFLMSRAGRRAYVMPDPGTPIWRRARA
ncbi:MAG: hypothetical protein KIT31_30575 [Deltaproteobacteria bacterium]|nr:hypothetical protein [Deltaproteobacteria bacterium]